MKTTFQSPYSANESLNTFIKVCTLKDLISYLPKFLTISSITATLLAFTLMYFENHFFNSIGVPLNIMSADIYLYYLFSIFFFLLNIFSTFLFITILSSIFPYNIIKFHTSNFQKKYFTLNEFNHRYHLNHKKILLTYTIPLLIFQFSVFLLDCFNLIDDQNILPHIISLLLYMFFILHFTFKSIYPFKRKVFSFGKETLIINLFIGLITSLLNFVLWNYLIFKVKNFIYQENNINSVLCTIFLFFTYYLINSQGFNDSFNLVYYGYKKLIKPLFSYYFVIVTIFIYLLFLINQIRLIQTNKEPVFFIHKIIGSGGYKANIIVDDIFCINFNKATNKEKSLPCKDNTLKNQFVIYGTLNNTNRGIIIKDQRFESDKYSIGLYIPKKNIEYIKILNKKDQNLK